MKISLFINFISIWVERILNFFKNITKNIIYLTKMEIQNIFLALLFNISKI